MKAFELGRYTLLLGGFIFFLGFCTCPIANTIDRLFDIGIREWMGDNLLVAWMILIGFGLVCIGAAISQLVEVVSWLKEKMT